MKLRSLVKNKRGQLVLSWGGEAGMLRLFFMLLLIVSVGLIVAFAAVGIKLVSDTVSPALKSLPNTGGTDLGGYATKGLGAWDTIMNGLYIGVGVLYMISLVGFIGISFAFRMTGQKYLIVLFLALAVLAILASILISNAYQSFYESGSAVGDELKEQVLMAWLMLHSPFIITIIIFISGIIMFTGMNEEVPLV